MKMIAAADDIRSEVRGTTYAEVGDDVPPGLRGTNDRMALTRIDSLVFGCVPTSWAGVSPQLRRTFVRPLHDRLYPADAQARLAAAFGAEHVVTVDAGHNAARSAPASVAAVVRDIAIRHAEEEGSEYGC